MQVMVDIGLVFFILMTIIVTVVLVMIAAVLTRPSRFGRLSGFITTGVVLAVVSGLTSLALGIYDIISGETASTYVVRMLIAVFLIALCVPILFIQRSKGDDAIRDPKVSQVLDRSTNDAFTVGISLQFIVLTLFVGEVVPIEYAVPLFGTVALAQVFLYLLVTLYRFRRGSPQESANVE